MPNVAGGEPEPIRGNKGAPFLWLSNSDIDRQNLDALDPPPTDAGVVPNLKWSFSLSHTRLLKGGWVRHQTVTDLPSSKHISAAEQRLAPYAYRVLHWHSVAEWAYVLNGSIRVSANDQDGRSYVADVGKGDLWAFEQGTPHTYRAGPQGAEVLIVFDNGDFEARGTTFAVDDWVAHTPRDILSHNFGWNESAFGTLPPVDPYLVAADHWPTLQETKEAIGHPSNVSAPFHYELSKQEPDKAPGGGGWVKIVDRRTFPASQTMAASLVYVAPGALRELHWHGNSAEWGYVLSGKGRTTAFVGGATARTFDLQAGDTWVFESNYGHFMKNTDSDKPLVFLEVFRAATHGQPINYHDVSLTQWLALTPPDMVARTLNVSIDLVRKLKKQKQVLIAPRA
ncbi:unnamed protein product [Parajaminaea phylloscopi]